MDTKKKEDVECVFKLVSPDTYQIEKITALNWDAIWGTATQWIPEVKDYKTFNDRVVVLEFTDGTSERAVCAPEDKFDLEIGLQTCLLKKALGGSGKMNNLVHKIIKKHEKLEKQAEKAKAQELLDKQNAEKRRKRKAEKRRRRAIDIQKTAITEAITSLKTVGDDLHG